MSFKSYKCIIVFYVCDISSVFLFSRPSPLMHYGSSNIVNYNQTQETQCYPGLTKAATPLADLISVTFSFQNCLTSYVYNFILYKLYVFHQLCTLLTIMVNCIILYSAGEHMDTGTLNIHIIIILIKSG